ncbi:hypothetical protein LIPSTDRAFT_30822 [Lipomyces starkeyi NRRL Y-11557]|uniref:NAD(P)-binding domain-containing protein n=1 Tax=Lipomyces starkeyi NRRL Y-11557 TaxID=675824 RepID=A0A1E3PVR4_LIPST|nr:hypothetical protein LIPSTDRAFT_30822 [Lipomyces starkeyi NRRL Y-11557]
MSDSTIVLITGASRSLGKALVQTYLSRPNHIVVGSVRDKASPNAQELNTLPPAAGSRLFLVGWTELGDHTEGGNISAKALGMEKPPNTIEESIKGVMVFISPILSGFQASLLITIDHAKIDQATREKSSGKFYDAINNTEIPW